MNRTNLAAEPWEVVKAVLNKWETQGDANMKAELINLALRNPVFLEILLEREKALYDRAQRSEEVLAEAQEILKARERGIREIAALIGLGPTGPEGQRTVIIDRAGRRCVVPVGENVELDTLNSEPPMVLLDQDGYVVGALRDYTPPSEIGVVREIDGNQLLVEFHADELITVDAPPSLRTTCRVGDRVKVDRKHSIVVGRLPAEDSASEWLLETCPPERFSDIAAQDHAISLIEEHVFGPLEHPDIIDALKINRSWAVLLIGPTGVGKTLTARALAGELHARLGKESVFLSVPGASIKSKWYGETSNRIRRLFDFALAQAKQGKVAVIFADEFDSIGRRRSAESEYLTCGADRDAVNTLLSCMEGVKTDRNTGLFVVAAVNSAAWLDPAVVSRFLPVYLTRPDVDGTAAICRKHLDPGVPVESSSDELIEKLVEHIHATTEPVLQAFLRDGKNVPIRRADLVNGRLIRDAVENAKWKAYREAKTSGSKPILRAAHLIEAAEELFDGICRAMAPENIADYVDIPACREHQVLRVTRCGFHSAHT